MQYNGYMPPIEETELTDTLQPDEIYTVDMQSTDLLSYGVIVEDQDGNLGYGYYINGQCQDGGGCSPIIEFSATETPAPATAVKEPASFGVLGVALVALIAARGRQTRAASAV